MDTILIVDDDVTISKLLEESFLLISRAHIADIHGNDEQRGQDRIYRVGRDRCGHNELDHVDIYDDERNERDDQHDITDDDLYEHVGLFVLASYRTYHCGDKEQTVYEYEDASEIFKGVIIQKLHDNKGKEYDTELDHTIYDG